MLNENGTNLQSALGQLGFECELKKQVISPRFEWYYFDLVNPVLINNLTQKTINILQNIFKVRLMFEKLVDYSFSIGFEHDEFTLKYDSFYWFKDEKHEKVNIGIDIQNNPLSLNFDSHINHILIGGATGSGKSTLLNTMITDIFSKGGLTNKPYIYLFDPKKVEFAKFQSLPMVYYESETSEIAKTLLGLVDLMEERYKVFVGKGMTDYKQANYQPLFIFVDELADLMMCGDETIEQSIIRLAQKGRGAGIHLILATQNPLAKVCTSLIKSNMTTRIALKCATKMQSIVVLDHIGAEKLLGRGDAIIKLPNKVDEIRFQYAYSSDDFIDYCVETIKNQCRQHGLL